MSEPVGHPETRLSEYLDGELIPAESEAVEGHLETCASCRAVLDDLAAVRERAVSLVDPPLGRDLWPGIREGLKRTPVIDLTTHMDGPIAGPRPIRRRGLFLSVPQLAAAAAALVVMAAGGTWGLVGAAGADAEAGTAVGAAPEAAAASVADPADPAPARFATHAAEAAELQETLRRGQGRLAPSTVRILEKNLALIDQAIRESQEALATDPGNPFVEEHLRRSYDRKVTYLREAAALLEAD